MPNSSKKSSKPSPSQASPAWQNEARPGSAIGRDLGRNVTDAPNQRKTYSKLNAAQINSKAKKAPMLFIPFGFGLTIVLEMRFFIAIFAASVLYIFAAIIANEWLYLLAAGFFAAAFLGAILPLVQVLDLSAEYSVPDEIVVNESAELLIRLKRLNRFGPLSWVMPIGGLHLFVNMYRRTPNGRANDSLLTKDPILVNELSEETWFKLPTPELIRGIYLVDKVQLASCFPFGLAWWKRTAKPVSVQDHQSLVVHPKLLPVSGNFLSRLEGLDSPMGLSSTNSIIVPHSSSIRGIREFRTGDTIRHIHWPSSAHIGRLVVREYESETLPVFDIILDLRAQWKNQEQFELAVSLIHSLIHLGYNLGNTPQLFLNPPLHSNAVINTLMSDLPQLPPSLILMSEILSRVDPLPQATMDDETTQAALEQAQAISNFDMPLLTIIPSSETIVKFKPGQGDEVISPIELAEIPRDWYEQEEELPELLKDRVELKVPRTKTVRSWRIGRPLNTKIIATIDSELAMLAL